MPVFPSIPIQSQSQSQSEVQESSDDSPSPFLYDSDVLFELSEKSEEEKFAYDILAIPDELNDCNIIKTRLQEYFDRKFFDENLFFDQWNHRDMIFELTNALDGSIHTCLYIAANTHGAHTLVRPIEKNRTVSTNHGQHGRGRSKTLKGRTQCDVGFCKNPKNWIENKNKRQRRSYSHKNKVPRPECGSPEDSMSDVTPLMNRTRGWCMLCYVILRLDKYTKAFLDEVGEKISKIKGMDNRILALLKFAIEHNEPFRVSKRLFNKNDSWYMRSVQLYLSGNVDFKAHVQSISSPILCGSDSKEVIPMDIS